MDQEDCASDVAAPASIHRVFNNRRENPTLPERFDWITQKALYSPRGLLKSSSPGLPKLDHEFGYVFCHRGLYERSLRILDNTVAAIKNGFRHDLFLHEIDAFVWDRLDEAFVAHDQNPRRITKKTEPWESYSLHEIFRTPLVSRRIEMELPSTADISSLEKKPPEIASSYLSTDEKVLALFRLLWKEKLEPSGLTLQIDFREEDFAKAISFYSFHISKQPYQYSNRRGAHHTLVWSMFQSIILKGYNKHYKSFGHLHKAITKMSENTYGRDYFQISHLHIFPPLIMVFYAKHLVELAEETQPQKTLWTKRSYEHLYTTFIDQVLSFVEVGPDKYNFILEIVHSGLGLHYNKVEGKAYNPLNGELLTNKVTFDSLVDRVMIDVSLELRDRKKYPRLLFSSCTRLPDVITPEQKSKAEFKTSRLVALEDGDETEEGLAVKLRAMPGGLYPRSDLVVADDPTAEIAARTWIDQEAGLDRSQLLHLTYYEWLEQANEKVVNAMKELNGDFLPNRVGDPISEETKLSKKPVSPINFNAKVMAWLRDGNSALNNEHDPEVLDVPSTHDEDGDGDGEYTCGQDIEELGYNFNFADEWSSWKDKQAGSDDGIHPERVVIRAGGQNITFYSGTEAKRMAASLAAYKAAEKGNEQALQKFLRKGAYVDATVGRHGTPLAVACKNGHIKTVQLLLEYEADVDKGEKFGSPLELASSNGHDAVVELLLGAGVDAGKIIPSLELASANGHAAIVKKLLLELKEKASPNATTGELLTGTALHKAAEYGHDSIVRLLLHHGADVNSTEGVYHTALQTACLKGHYTTAKLLLDKGADISITEVLFGPPLRAAATFGHLSIVELLLARGADINYEGPGGWTVIQTACVRGHYDVAKLLLDRGADVNIPLQNGQTTFWLETSAPEIQSLLADSGVDIKSLPRRGVSEDQGESSSSQTAPKPTNLGPTGTKRHTSKLTMRSKDRSKQRLKRIAKYQTKGKNAEPLRPPLIHCTVVSFVPNGVAALHDGCAHSPDRSVFNNKDGCANLSLGVFHTHFSRKAANGIGIFPSSINVILESNVNATPAKMRLLHTKTYRLYEFFNEEVPPYAILSHTWGSKEINFEEIQDRRNSYGFRSNPGFPKVKGACSLAHSENYEFIWIDTCCINKSSSSELSEAINSMYLWYKRADVCYAYLADVNYRSEYSPVASTKLGSESNIVLNGNHWNFDESEFRESRWFTRGWTLQELIAPNKVIFYSRDWKSLGTKVTLRPLISSITSIEETVLAGGGLEVLSVARKMSWASNRTTTRKEDLAYCLMGIFSVNMPLLYGEGDKAFVRLQEQIITKTNDQSIFAWKIPQAEGQQRALYGLLAPSPKAFIETGKRVSLFAPVHRRKQAIRIVNNSLEFRALLRQLSMSERFPYQHRTGYKFKAISTMESYFSAVLDCQMGVSGDSWFFIDVVQLYPEDGHGGMILARINPSFISTISLKETVMTNRAFHALYGGASSLSESWHGVLIDFLAKHHAMVLANYLCAPSSGIPNTSRF
ncbi:ankyrin repeat-containing protein [Fusarium beomiforme]|uniref:Ankyrin repeat-containing protein n=1 Tax=Fusarium beomiforme TaxID=44412 RepID=A0A9P5AVT3_9HYPO|nr:ankyrin repeat-containing protein [Fusarium beomiforme]